MANYVNESKTTERGLALLGLYSNHRRVIPSIDIFVSDYFKIASPSMSNRTLIRETTTILKEIYEGYKKCPDTKISISIVL